MGDDARILDAARISTGASSKSDEKDKKRIDSLMEEKHYSPFEKIVFEFHVKCPLFIARQWMRHRIGSFNEESARYKQLKFETFSPNEWRKQYGTSSTEKFTETEEIQFYTRLDAFYEVTKKLYDWYIEQGVARELARTVMPLGVFTSFYWTVNFRSLMNFLDLRDAKGAQYEIREYAKAIKSILSKKDEIKWTWSSFNKR